MVQSLKQNSVHDTELKIEQYTWCRAETKKTRSRMMKDEFYASYLKKKNSTLLNKWID